MGDNTHPCDYAFPVAPGDVPYWQPGMTLRDWFAGQALAGWMASFPSCGEGVVPVACARLAYDLADAMLEARAKGGA